MTEHKAPKLIFTVLLVNGREISHTYDVPPNLEEAKELVDSMVKMIAAAMSHRKETYLHLMHPSISYNPDSVSGVRFHAFEAKELEEAIEEAQRKLGFTED